MNKRDRVIVAQALKIAVENDAFSGPALSRATELVGELEGPQTVKRVVHYQPEHVFRKSTVMCAVFPKKFTIERTREPEDVTCRRCLWRMKELGVIE